MKINYEEFNELQTQQRIRDYLQEVTATKTDLAGATYEE